MLRKANAGRVSLPAEIVAGDWQCGSVAGREKRHIEAGRGEVRHSGAWRRPFARAQGARDEVIVRLAYRAMRVSIDSCFIFSSGAGPVDARTTNSASTAISGW
jgi:hypothetical protein